MPTNSTSNVLTERNFVIGILAGVLLVISTIWILQSGDSVAETNNAQIMEKCTCGEASSIGKLSSEGQDNRLAYCKCGNLDCVVAKGSFGGFGGNGENYGISCVKR